MPIEARRTLPRGIELLHRPELNKGTAFSPEERRGLGLEGLLPPRVFSQEEQVARVLDNFARKSTDLERYIFLIALQDRNERLFYRVVIEHIEQMMPIIYTPTVGEACQQYAHIFRRPRGLYVSAADRGRVAELLRNWTRPEVGIMVVTDGERILGLGDLGANGMGIPVGKLSLYTACGGVDPGLCLPVMLDVGTDNEELLADPLYLGLPQRRLRGEAYDALVEELVTAVDEVFGGPLIQFEDFANRNAFPLLERYRDRACAFNDDIQGTAAVTLAGLLSALRITGGNLRGQKLLFLGAGAAATGIADLVVSAMVEEGMPEGEARRRCWFVDSSGLVVDGRERLADHKLPYAHPHSHVAELSKAVAVLRPTALIGVSGQPGAFGREVVEAMAEAHERPVVFALSNPTSKAECTAEQAYRWSAGRAIFAGGSPFDPVELDGRRLVPGQGNNAYIFPGVGLGVIASGARRVPDSMFLAAARTLASMVGEERLAQGSVYPPLTAIREVSVRIATAVAEIAYRQGLATGSEPPDLPAHVQSLVYRPEYPELLASVRDEVR